MFIEPKLVGNKQKSGWIEVVCGSMFSGKTEELIRRVNRAVIAKQEVKIFKPAIDTRYDDVKVVSHNSNAIISTPVQKAKEILELSKTAHVIAIDEAQFMDKDILNVCIKLANKGKRVIVCGLDMDFEGKPFGMMPELMSIAEYITKLHAICMECGEMASYSFRLVQSKEKVMLGEKDSYEARCRRCFVKGNKEKKKSKQAQVSNLV